jgi:hypothetical protein
LWLVPDARVGICECGRGKKICCSHCDCNYPVWHFCDAFFWARVYVTLTKLKHAERIREFGNEPGAGEVHHFEWYRSELTSECMLTTVTDV